MLTFTLHSITAWSDYFPGTSPTTNFSSKEFTSRQTPSTANVYISNCLFNKCTSSDTGGALYCSTSVTYLLVESSSFFSCKTSSSSGAIYFKNTDSGECVLYMICANDCYSTSSLNEQFGWIEVKDGATNKNYINYSSIVRCVNENSGTWRTLYLWYGKIFCPSVNISMNKCGYRSGFSCSPFPDSNSVTCLISYSSFTNNIALSSICIYFNKANAKYEMKSCNILRNTQVNLNDHGTFRLYGNLMIKDSCILENNANYIFNSASSSYTFTLSNCTIDKTTISNGILTIQNTATKSFIHALNHMSTLNCNSEYDSAGTLTPIIQTPSSSKKSMYYCTYKIFFNQPNLRDIISIINVFLFNFIHPYFFYLNE
jgi:hypothetical protein